MAKTNPRYSGNEEKKIVYIKRQLDVTILLGIPKLMYLKFYLITTTISLDNEVSTVVACHKYTIMNCG